MPRPETDAQEDLSFGSNEASAANGRTNAGGGYSMGTKGEVGFGAMAAAPRK
jgi:hypothetical protein